jgi:hypothetical protein
MTQAPHVVCYCSLPSIGRVPRASKRSREESEPMRSRSMCVEVTHHAERGSTACQSGRCEVSGPMSGPTAPA